ncbi:hypothetical protein NMG60_11034978 [Bertholletia excelsa]
MTVLLKYSPASPRKTSEGILRREVEEEETTLTATMATPSFLSHLILLSLLTFGVLIVSPSAAKSTGTHHHQWSWTPAKPVCKGSIAECMAAGELEMDSEISRRMLATTKYISYGALQRNTVPCSLRGASYYNCKPGAEANPYSRGCSTITRCRS